MNIQISTIHSKTILLNLQFTSTNMKYIQREVYSNGEKYSKSEFSKYYHLCYISIHQNNNDRIALVYDNLCDDTIEKCP